MASSDESTTRSGGLDQAAEALRDDIDQAGRRLELSTGDLLGRFGIESLDEETAGRVGRVLGAQGISARPGPNRLFAQGVDRLEQEAPAGPGSDDPLVVRVADLPDGPVVLTRGPALALQGVALIGIPAAAVGAATYWLYGVVTALAAVAAAVLASVGFDWLDRRLPSGWPRGRLLGVALGAVLIGLVGVTVVLPVRSKRTNDAQARFYVKSANEAIDLGDVKGASTALAAAAKESPGYQPAVLAQIRLLALQNQLTAKDLDRKQFLYEEAKRAARENDFGAAVRRLRSIRGFRDANELLPRYRRLAAGDGK